VTGQRPQTGANPGGGTSLEAEPSAVGAVRCEQAVSRLRRLLRRASRSNVYTAARAACHELWLHRLNQRHFLLRVLVQPFGYGFFVV